MYKPAVPSKSSLLEDLAKHLRKLGLSDPNVEEVMEQATSFWGNDRIVKATNWTYEQVCEYLDED